MAGQTEVGPDTKAVLAGLATLDLPGPLGISPLSVQVQRLVHSLATSFETGVAALELPESCLWRTSAMQEADDALA